MLKQIRIGANGRIVDADRSVHTTRDAGKGGPDQVQWVRQGAGNYTIRFSYLAGSPFQAAKPQSIIVPPGGPQTVTQPAGVYKYDVLDANDVVVDDPDVIIDS